MIKLPLSNFDELDILYISAMDLPTKEKYLRLQMMTEFELRIKRLLEKQEKVANNKDLSTSEIILALELFTIPLIKQYRVFSDKYYSMYVSLISNSDKTGYTKADNWIKQHSVDFGNWVQSTTLKEFENENTFSDSRIKDIVRTETNELCQLATLDGFYREGYTRKKWIAFLDKKARDSHIAANGQIKRLDEPFCIGDSLLMFPQDSSMGASAKEIVNCRCIMQPVK